ILPMARARLAGSSLSRASGRPCATSQKGQRRVHLSPIIIKVAVPFPKHSPMLGQLASSHTVKRLVSRRMRLMSLNLELGAAALTRIQLGFLSGLTVRSTLIGMRDVFSLARWWREGSYSVRGRTVGRWFG